MDDQVFRAFRVSTLQIAAAAQDDPAGSEQPASALLAIGARLSSTSADSALMLTAQHTYRTVVTARPL